MTIFHKWNCGKMHQNEICNFEICFETLFEILKLLNFFFYWTELSLLPFLFLRHLVAYNLLYNSLLYNSLFTIVKDKSESANILNNYLSEISKWAYNWKMLFNPDPSKPAQEVEFSRKKTTKSSRHKPK